MFEKPLSMNYSQFDMHLYSIIGIMMVKSWYNGTGQIETYKCMNFNYKLYANDILDDLSIGVLRWYVINVQSSSWEKSALLYNGSFIVINRCLQSAT